METRDAPLWSACPFCSRSGGGSNVDGTSATYPIFVECVGHVALVSHAKPYLQTKFPLPHEQVDNLFSWMKASQRMTVSVVLLCLRLCLVG